jgi:hypothetical protein
MTNIFNETPANEGKMQPEYIFLHVGALSYLLIASKFASFVEVWLQ